MSRTISAALLAHYAGSELTTSKLMIVTLTNGTVFRFTDHDQNIVYSGDTYFAAVGFSATDIKTTAGLNVDNLEVDGPMVLTYPGVLELDILAGLWDYASINIFEVNRKDGSMGKLNERIGTIGQVTFEDGAFKSELRGLTQRYTRTIGRIDDPACDANLGDSRCTINIALFSFAFTVTSVNPDNVTFYCGLAQGGPTSPVSVLSITNANPGVVTLTDNSLNLTINQALSMYNVGGMVKLNNQTIARNARTNTDGTFSFDLGIDTTNVADYPAYTGGGLCVALGGSSGYFDNGYVVWSTGLNIGLKQDVRQYAPGQVALALPMPYAIAPGDTGVAAAGCNKLYPTCRDRFNNVLNFRGSPFFPGQDNLIQVGRHL